MYILICKCFLDNSEHLLLNWNLTILSDSDCDEFFIRYESEICGIATESLLNITTNTDYCFLHYGSAIILYDDYNDPMLIGIGSTLSCDSEMPSVFQRITKYLDWITKVTEIYGV